MGLYELAVLFDPRLPDEGVADLSDSAKELLTSLGAEIVKEESWGKKRLAYPIQKLTEARYVFFTVKVDGANPFPEVEQRLEQNDKVLRYLTVRLDAGRLRKRGEEPEAATAAAAAAPVTPSATETAPTEAKEAS